ncbi:hypothetical protein GQ457_07G037780 [Hibiscus cannabinus]
MKQDNGGRQAGLQKKYGSEGLQARPSCVWCKGQGGHAKGFGLHRYGTDSDNVINSSTPTSTTTTLCCMHGHWSGQDI